MAIDPSEYVRIQTAKQYYKDDLPPYYYRNSYGQKRHRPLCSLNVTKLAVKRMASIIFDEQCEISLKDSTLDGFVNDIISSNHFNLQFEQHLETGIALGGLAARPYVDDQNNIRIAWANADQFYPLRNNTDNISECVFASRTTRVENKQSIYYTLLEFHQWKDSDTYVITNELYRSTSRDVVGNQVPLGTIYPNLQEQIEFNGGRSRNRYLRISVCQEPTTKTWIARLALASWTTLKTSSMPSTVLMMRLFTRLRWASAGLRCLLRCYDRQRLALAVTAMIKCIP